MSAGVDERPTEHQLGAGRTSSADCTCPRSSGGYRRGIDLNCPWDGTHPETFRKAPTA